MNLEIFFEKFDLFADCPNAVQKMRELILELAVQGKLVEQREEEGSGRDILWARKAKEIDGSDLIQIPDNWCWTSFGQICDYIQRGKGPKYSDKGKVRVISQKCVQWAGFDLSVARFVEDFSLSAYGEERYLRAGDLLWNSTGTGTAGRAIVVPQIDADLVADSHVTVVRSNSVDSRYLWCLIASPSIQCRFDPKHETSLVSGSTNQVELATGVVKAMPFPLPPLAEQKRIVAKVDELMAFCDALEAQQKEREAKRTALAKAALAAFAEAPSPLSLELLFHPSYAIDPADLRKSILTLAVQGKLVEQRGVEGNGIRVVESAKAFLDARFSKKRAQRVREECADIKCFPNNWAETSLGDLLKLTSGDGLTARQMCPGEIPVFGGNGVSGCHNVANLKGPALVVGRVGFYCGSVHIVPTDSWVTDNAFVVSFDESVLDLRFIFWLLKGTDLRERDNATAQPVISGSKVYPINLGIPPLAEQKRIVAKVDELMALVDRLEGEVKAAQETGARLLEAMVAELSGKAA